MDKSASHDDVSSNRNEERSKKLKEEFKCGQPKCMKLYHSYTAFYNHCKKAHAGEFPAGSLLNNDYFEGPTKNRGRPRMKKNEAKNQLQIESMKAQNQLIEFLGTIRIGTNKSNEELISYVEEPLQNLKESISSVKQLMKNDERSQKYLTQLANINQIICDNDLPEYYDPVEHEKYSDRVDSYNFNSILKFFKKRDFSGMKYSWLLICWLARILSQKLLTETIYILLQNDLGLKIKEIDFFCGKSAKFIKLVENYFKYVNERQNDEEISI